MNISSENHQQQNSITNKILLQTIVQKTSYLSPYNNFYFALKSEEVKRQYPKLLKIVFDYIMITDNDKSIINSSSLSLEEKSETFTKIALESPEYIQSRIISFIIHQKDRMTLRPPK